MEIRCEAAGTYYTPGAPTPPTARQVPHYIAWVNCLRGGLNAVLTWVSLILCIMVWTVDMGDAGAGALWLGGQGRAQPGRLGFQDSTTDADARWHGSRRADRPGQAAVEQLRAAPFRSTWRRC